MENGKSWPRLVSRHANVREEARVENDHMVRPVPAVVANPALGNAFLSMTSQTGALWPDSETLCCVNDLAIEA